MAKSTKSMIDIVNLSKSYSGPDGTVSALRDISISLDSGEFLAVQGPSGCGKSTLLFAAGTMLTPGSGTVNIDGKDPYIVSPDKRAEIRVRNIGFVFQEYFLIPYLNAYENILIPSLAVKNKNNKRETSAKKENQKRAAGLLKSFRLEGRKNHKASELSSGERQRTAIARALFNCPKILLADEPTGNLDRENEEIVLNYLQDFANQGGTVLMVTHSERAAGYASREIHMRNGKILN